MNLAYNEKSSHDQGQVSFRNNKDDFTGLHHVNYQLRSIMDEQTSKQQHNGLLSHSDKREAIKTTSTLDSIATFLKACCM